MKVMLSQVIGLKTFNKGCFSMRKEFETNIIPHVGDYIEDSVWKDPYEYKVIETIINYQENQCYVSLECIKFDHDNKEVLKEWCDMVKLHGWSTSPEQIN
ncbi:hypothetical protein PMW00_13370 [Clostridium paraputrificum]|uniref:hypothetical protein n=1 Tax=Clostridium paraputrificum TaxID=29363 RepID=UPI00232FFC6B|nr:hypothetical protein [Clostridium paraputrificum]MDB2104006.1 hypothetical protein [Clostridium paraputrificum]